MLELKQKTEQELVAEARKHRISRVLATAPGLGPIRVAQLLPIVVTPHRFRTRGGVGLVGTYTVDLVQSLPFGSSFVDSSVPGSATPVPTR